MIKRWLGENRLSEMVLDQTFDNVIVTDADLTSGSGPKMLFVNRAVCQLTGYAREELIGKTPHIFHGKDTDRKTLDRLKATLLAGDISLETILNYKKDGSSYWVELQITPLHSEDGDLIGYVSVQRDVTDRKRRKIEKERTDRWASLGETIADFGTWAIDLDAERVFWSSGMFDILERDPSRGPPANLDVLASIVEEDRDKISALMRQVVKEGAAFETEARCITEKGNVRWLKVRGEAQTNDEGRTLAVVGATRDITKDHETDQNLAAVMQMNDDLNRDFLTARAISKIGIFDYSVQEDKQYWTDELFEMTGLEKASFPAPADKFISLLDEKDRPRFDRLFENAVQSGEGYQTRVLLHRPDGQDVHMQIVADVKDEGGDRRIVGIARDVTDEIEASELLQAQEERFRLIAGLVSDVIWDFNLEEDRHWVTPNWPEKIGLDLQNKTISPAQWSRLVVKEDRGRFMTSLQNALRSGATVWTEETKVADPDGRRANVLIKASFLRRDDGVVYRALGNIRNIDREKRINELVARNHGLESLRDMTGGIAHDFNNLLMIVIGNAELLRMSDLIQADKDAVDLIDNAANSASQLTKRLLEFSGASSLKKTVVDLRGFMDRIEPLVKSSLTNSIEVSIHLDDDLWPIASDATALEQAILNFALNARDAMDGSGHLTIECENTPIADEMFGNGLGIPSGRYVCINVTDDGKGMDEKTLARAREPFFTTKDVGKGTGLGLSSAYGFARQSGGAIQIYSELDVGTTIKLYLPASGKAADQMRDGQTALQKKPKRSTGSILVVEDKDEIRSHLITALSRAGYQVSEAATGAEGLAKVEQDGPYDLLLTDIVMPGGMNGVELAEKAAEIDPEMKVLFSSGFAGAAIDEKLALNSPPGKLLRKPYRLTDLYTAVSSALSDDE